MKWTFFSVLRSPRVTKNNRSWKARVKKNELDNGGLGDSDLKGPLKEPPKLNKWAQNGKNRVIFNLFHGTRVSHLLISHCNPVWSITYRWARRNSDLWIPLEAGDKPPWDRCLKISIFLLFCGTHSGVWKTGYGSSLGSPKVTMQYWSRRICRSVQPLSTVHTNTHTHTHTHTHTLYMRTCTWTDRQTDGQTHTHT